MSKFLTNATFDESKLIIDSVDDEEPDSYLRLQIDANDFKVDNVSIFATPSEIEQKFLEWRDENNTYTNTDEEEGGEEDNDW